MTQNQIIEMVRGRRDWKRLSRFDQRMQECDCYGWPAMLEQDAIGRAYYAAMDLLDAVNDIVLRDKIDERHRRYRRCYNRASK